MAGKGIIDALSDPDVYVGSGVPAIIGATSGSLASATDYASLVTSTLEASAISGLADLYNSLTGNEWGLFDSSGTALFPDAIMLQVGGNITRVISNAPVQDGSFTSYNKVANPTQLQVGFSFQGSISAKQTQMAALQALADGTDLVTVRMPEWSQTNVNVVGISFMRSARSGADLLMPVATLQEVRIYATTTYTQTKTGIVATTEQTGTVQATQVTTAQSVAISS